jgi:ubiquinone/menaquinone biosynthesis C-methylase UbiE/uncharacterized protein YbaR (Trm112 family)
MMEKFPLACPRCRGELQLINSDSAVCEADDLRFERLDGIWRFVLPDRRAYFDQFIRDYEAVRRGEERGADSAAYYRALPYHDLSGKRSADWRIRAASYRAFSKQVLGVMGAQNAQPLTILDLGAGNCWLSYRMARLGHMVGAVDLTTNEFDGLACHRFYDADFTPIEAEFDHLPILDRSIDLIVFNASLHYSENYEATLSESLRALKQGGRLVIIDSPIYHRPDSGRQMVAERESEFIQRFGFPSNALRNENYLTYERLEDLKKKLNLTWKFLTPNYGLRWKLRPIKARLLGKREPASFQIVVGRMGVTPD